MPTLTIDNDVNISNVNGITLTATPVANANLSIVTVSGPKGDRGNDGLTPSGISIEALNATGGLLSSEIEQTGRTLYNDIVGLSGLINAGGVTQSQLDATGAKITSLSGYVDNNFYLRTNPSGYITGFDSGNYATNTNLASTGQQTWNAGQNNSINLSGNLALTGSAAILAAITYSNGIGTNLSGNLVSTGQTLILRNSNTSGELSDRLTASGYRNWIYASGVSGNVESTGQQLWNITIGNAINLSGNLNSTGQQLLNSINNNGINLSGNLSSTGSKNWIYTTGLSGNLGLTGQTLGIAIQNNSINLSGNLASTGSAAIAASVAYTNTVGTNISGDLALTGQQAWQASQNNALNLSGRLVASGALLSAVRITGSNTIQNPNFTGLGGTLIIQSGNFVFISGASQQQAAQQNHDDGINLSGRLSQTGATLWQRDLDISGALELKISANAAGVGSVNGLSGSLNIFGTGSVVSITSAGQSIYVSGNNNDGTNISGNLSTLAANLASTGLRNWLYTSGLSGNLTATGQALLVIAQNNATNISGNLASTGQQAWTAANNNALNLSGNLSSTGNRNWLYTSGVSGNLILSGQSLLATIASTGQQVWDASNNNAINLSGRDTNISGALEGRIFSTGAAASASANSIGVTLSGNLASTGQSLLLAIASTGQGAWNAAQNNSTNLSGGLFNTGATLITRNLDTSGELSNRLQQTGSLVSAVKVTGSTTIQNVNLSGLGGTLVIQSGNFVLISGAAGGNGVTNHDDGINLSGNLNASGRRAWDDAINLSGRLFATGAAAILQANSIGTTISGNLTLSGQSLLTTIASTGNQAWNHSQNNALNLSGNLFNTGSNLNALIYLMSGQITSGDVGLDLAWSGALSSRLISTGSLLSAVKVTGSSVIQNVNLTGIAGALVFASGGYVVISGSIGGGIATSDHGDGINLSGNLTQSGSVLWQRDIDISGALVDRMAAGGTVVSVTGSASQATVDITGAGSNTVLYIGNKVIISGSATSATTSSLGAFGISIDGGTQTISTGFKGYFQINDAMALQGWNIVAFSSGSIVFDIFKSDLSVFPSFSSIITGGDNFPNLNSVNKAYSSNLSGWNTSIGNGDYLEFVVKGCTGIKKININITGIKS